MLRTKLNLLKKRKYIWFCHIVRYRSPTVALPPRPHGDVERGRWWWGGGCVKGKQRETEGWRPERRSVAVRAKHFGRERTWQHNTKPAWDRERNQSQTALLTLHRCTAQTVTWYLGRKEMKWGLTGSLLQILVRFPEPPRFSTAPGVNCVSLIGAAYVWYFGVIIERAESLRFISLHHVLWGGATGVHVEGKLAAVAFKHRAHFSIQNWRCVK